jgi:hypothetical protein
MTALGNRRCEVILFCVINFDALDRAMEFALTAQRLSS